MSKVQEIKDKIVEYEKAKQYHLDNSLKTQLISNREFKIGIRCGKQIKRLQEKLKQAERE
jgi:hypothetical protein